MTINDTNMEAKASNSTNNASSELSNIQNKTQSWNTGIFTIKKANDVLKEASERPDPQELWYSFWHEGEVCCLFADTNAGKSILAVQIAETIAQTGTTVLYFDFELSDKQFQLRYTDDNTKELYQFSSNLYRVEINPEAVTTSNFEQAILESIEKSIIATKAHVLIIDNITYLCMNSEKGADAGNLMIQLTQFKRKYGLSLLVLAHTPKRQLYNPLTQNDLAGSKRQMNFFDSSFAIGKSARNEETRYIKQIKVRFGKFTYNGDNVMVCKIEKENAFLKYVHVGISTEREHLKEKTDEEVAKFRTEVKNLYAQGNSYRKIGQQTGLSKSEVARIVKQELSPKSHASQMSP